MVRTAARRRLGRRVAPDEDGRRLDRLLETWLPEAVGGHVSRSAVRRLVMAGFAKVDGQVLRRPGAPLRAGSRVDAIVDPACLGPPPAEREAARCFGPERFLYRDAFVLAVDKPAGLAMHATADASRPNLYDLVKGLLRADGAEPYLGLHQRLDRDTSGVVLFTLDPAANGPLAAAFASGSGVAKIYHALCSRPEAPPRGWWRVAGPLGEDGPWAEALFRVERTLATALLVEARPTTGRKHQVRIQLADRGLPILGDSRYGSRPDRSVPRVMLHALRLVFTHPVTGAEITVTSPYPEDFESTLGRRSSGRPQRRRARSHTRRSP